MLLSLYRSGTGRRDSTKRSGKGAYNWGCDYEMYEVSLTIRYFPLWEWRYFHSFIICWVMIPQILCYRKTSRLLTTKYNLNFSGDSISFLTSLLITVYSPFDALWWLLRHLWWVSGWPFSWLLDGWLVLFCTKQVQPINVFK